MSDHDLRAIVERLAKSVDFHDKIINGDDRLGVEGLREEQKKDNEFRKFTTQKLEGLENAIHESNRIVLNEIGKVAVWKEGIQATPKKIFRAVTVASAFLAGLVAIGSFVWNSVEKVIDWVMDSLK